MNSYILRNKDKDDKKIYYMILIISIIISYVILSIQSLDVFRYVSNQNKEDITSTAYIMYLGSLSFIFFLVYTSIDYSISIRRKEIGLYIMHGIKLRQIMSKLTYDMLKDTIISMMIGIPLGIFINEFINLFTIKILDLGLNNHKFAFSFRSIIIVFFILFIIEIISLFSIILRYINYEPIRLLKEKSNNNNLLSDILTLILILTSLYILTNARLLDIFVSSTIIMFVIIFIIVGMIITIFKRVKNKDYFIKRQILDILITERFQIVISTYIMTFALIFLIIAINNTLSFREETYKAADFTLVDENEKIDLIKANKYIMEKIGDFYPIYARGNDKIDTSLINELIISELNDSNFISVYAVIEPYLLLNEKSLKNISKDYGKERLKDDEAIILTRFKYERDALIDMVHRYPNLTIKIEDKSYKLLDYTLSSKIFSNDVIKFNNIVVINNSQFNKINPNVDPFAYNINLNKNFINTIGFNEASEELRSYFIRNDFKYESYIRERKNKLSDIVNTIYGMLYIGIIFFLTSTVYIAIRILIIGQRNANKYEILLKLGLLKSNLKWLLLKQIYILYSIITLISFVSAYAFIFFNYSATYRIRQYLSNFEFNINILLIFLAVIITNQFLIRIIKNITDMQIENLEV